MLPSKIVIALALTTTITACNNISYTDEAKVNAGLDNIAGIEHIETVSKSRSGISIPYQKLPRS